MDTKNLLFIGSSYMNLNGKDPITNYTQKYKKGIFIEAIPSVYEILKKNIEYANKNYGCDYKALNNLVTSEKEKEYTFHLFSNKGKSSSIYKANEKTWKWPHATEIDTINLKSTTIEEILKDENWENIKFDVILDVQGAELEVLKGFGNKNLKNIKRIKTEISTKEFYKGGVLFNELNKFFIDNNFVLMKKPNSEHCDVIYKNKNN